MKKNLTYAVIDIETTGGRADRDRITEIGVVITDGKNIIDSFESLVNPETSIPYEITRLTGIDNQMVSDAPKFYEIAKRIVEMTEETIFVAHNVRFDYGFIQEEFRRLGYAYTRKKICTVVLSRKAFPGLRSYSLGNLIQHFNIEAERRHRALDDAKATTVLLSYILDSKPAVNEINRLVRDLNLASLLPANISADKINSLPETCGVYYFYDRSGELAYIGKSINIKNRVWEHFKGINHKGEKMQNFVADISFKETGSELAAYLVESYEIKKFKPYLNKASKNSKLTTGLYIRYDKHAGNYFSLENRVDENDADYLISYPSLRAGKKALNNIIREFNLCPDVSTGIVKNQPCFDHMIGYCYGVCCGKENQEDYLKRMELALAKIKVKLEGNWFLVDKAVSYEEQTVFYIEDGIYKGHCVISKEDAPMASDIIDSIKPVSHQIDYQKIIKRYFNKSFIKKVRLGTTI